MPQDQADRTIDRLAGALARLDAGRAAARAEVQVAAWHVDGEPLPTAEALRQADFRPVNIGSAWGPAWGTTWFRLRGTVPADWAGRPVDVELDLGYTPWPPGFQAEALVVDSDGVPLRGMHPRQRRYRVSDRATSGQRVEVLVEAAANPGVTSFTAGGADTANAYGGPATQVLADAALVLPAADIDGLWADLDVLRTLLVVRGAAGTDSRRVAEVVAACDRACDILGDGIDAATVAAARAAVAAVLAAPAGADTDRIALVGHAHLDTAWLWPVRETVRKATRTYANVAALMDEDPDLTFAGSQAAQHDWVRDRHPALWSRVVARAREGRWVPVGGMWVESDVLLPSGESLARQLLIGQRFFAEHLGRTARTGWLPDCFGFTPALPQLLRQAGIDGFVTQKLSWNDTTRFPYRSFLWEGLDGSRVLAHFPTVDTYNADLSAEDLARVTAAAHAGQHVADSLAPLGYGDGGGGPTALMLQRASRMRDLDGLPRVRFVDPDAFLVDVDRDGLPLWHGDLYLETHRGVWTSQQRTKQGDARCDETLRQAEMWCTAAALAGLADYPSADLDALWKRHLLLEFHDILPGTSITRVHREAETEHDAIEAAAAGLRDAALRLLGGAPRPSGPSRVTPRPGPGGTVLDNGLVRAVVAATGHVTSLVDLGTGAERCATGSALGVLHLHDDRPTVFDAWNLDRDYLRSGHPLDAVDRVEATADEVRATRAFGASVATHRWWLEEGARHLSLQVDVDWRESDRVLKLALPVAAGPDARLRVGVQHGLVPRPLVPRDERERARYEDWFHRFLLLTGPAEDGVGVAVVTAGCHGYDTVGSAVVEDGVGAAATLRLSLLRAPRFPDPDCDRGAHTFRIDLHVGADAAAATVAGHAARAALATPASDAGVTPPVRVEGHGVVLDTVKLAEDGSGDVVVRLHEAVGVPTRAVLSLGFQPVAAVGCDLLERTVDPDESVGTVMDAAPETAGATVAVDLPAFGLRTLRITPRRPPARAVDPDAGR